MSKFFEEITQEISEKRYQQGMQQGEQKQKLIIARSLLSNGSSIDFVIKNTKLDEETVKALKEELIH